MTEDPYRGTGRTTRQMTDAPTGATYIVGSRMVVPIVKAIAAKIGRNDLNIQPAENLRVNLRGAKPREVVVDHAVTLDDEQRFTLDRLSSRVSTDDQWIEQHVDHLSDPAKAKTVLRAAIAYGRSTRQS